MFIRKKILLFVALFIFIFFLPQLVLTLVSLSKIYTLEEISSKEYGIVFGAQVYTDYVLSPVAEQRIEAAVIAYHQGKIKKLYISGANSTLNEVDAIAQYAIEKGAAEDDIIKDNFGLDTSDTCRHFSEINNEAILFTQQYHLPRALYMCTNQGIRSIGIAVNKTVPKNQDINTLQIITIRASRLLRESELSWLYLIGIYDKLSNKAK